MVASGYYKLSAKNGDLSNNCPPQEIKVRRCCGLSIRWRWLAVLAFCTFLVVTFVVLNYPSATVNDSSVLSLASKDEEIKERLRLKSKIRFKHTQRVLPNCLLIGARKAGTRALLTFLNLHPQIQAAKNEVHFFDEDDTYAEGVEWYRKKMPYSFPGQITMEKTPAYFVAEKVAERVWHMNSTIKLLLVVRDPVARAVSDYLQISLNKKEKNKAFKKFEELAMTESGEVDHTYNAIRRSLYARHLAKWLKFFPLKQIHIVNGEGLVENPVKYLKRVERFLGLDPYITDENFYFNETRGFYCIRNETMEKCLNPSKGRAHPDIKPEVMRKLRTFFRPWNERFYHMTGQDFGWP